MPSPLTSPLLINSKAVVLHADNFDEIVAAMDIPDSTPDTKFVLDQSTSSLRHQAVRLVPDTVAVAYYKGVIAAISAVDAVLYLHALGGRYETRSLRPHRVEHIVVGGTDQKCAVTVRAGKLFCGPIWCAPRRRDDLLATLPWLAMRGGPRWCTPIDNYGKLRCAACDAAFSTAAELFAHGGIPARQKEPFHQSRYLIPPDWTPLPSTVELAPVAANNLAEGSLADRSRPQSRSARTYGDHRTHALRVRLDRLQRRHGDRYVPYVIRRVYR